MRDSLEWIGLADAVHRANGLLTYWGLYSMAMRNEIESRRKGRIWQVKRLNLDQYISELRAQSVRDAVPT
jgi:hypothetical protein